MYMAKVSHFPLSFSSSISVEQQLRLLELNSWQLLRLLEAQLPGLVCENFLCDVFRDDGSGRTRGYNSVEETFCCLYLKAADLHRLWKSGEEKRWLTVCNNLSDTLFLRTFIWGKY